MASSSDASPRCCITLRNTPMPASLTVNHTLLSSCHVATSTVSERECSMALFSISVNA